MSVHTLYRTSREMLLMLFGVCLPMGQRHNLRPAPAPVTHHTAHLTHYPPAPCPPPHPTPLSNPPLVEPPLRPLPPSPPPHPHPAPAFHPPPLFGQVHRGLLPPEYRTRLCASLEGGRCPLGARCSHAHSLQELRVEAAVKVTSRQIWLSLGTPWIPQIP